MKRERERENNKKFIENNMRRKKVRIKNIAIVRTSFGLDPKQNWVLAQQAQTINLQSVGKKTNQNLEKRSKLMNNLHFIPNNILIKFFKDFTKYKNDYQQCKDSICNDPK